MKKRSPAPRRSALSAKFFVAALCVVLGFGAASAIPGGSTLGETWRFRLEAFGPFSTSARRDAERPLSYLDASGRRVALDASSAPRFDSTPAFVSESTELLANDASPAPEPVGATFDEAEPESTPVSFANAETAPEAEEPTSLFTDDGWFVVDADDRERDEWSRELRLETFPEPTFAECSAPTWRDAVAVEAATLDELRALEFEPGVGSSSLVSSSLRRRAANARLVSGDYSFAETSNASDANAPQTSVAPAPVPTTAPTSTVPTRVGAFTACGTFDTNGVVKVRVQ